MKPTRSLVALSLLLALGACKQAQTEAPPAPPPTATLPAVTHPTPMPAGGCSDDEGCRVGQKCCAGSCQEGDCCGNADCGGRICEEGACRVCAGDTECGAGAVCCGGLCKPGSCCADAQCPGGQRCVNNQCSTCAADSECAAGQKCCAGACTTATCCGNADCGGGLCLDGNCQPCTADGQCGEGKVCCHGSCTLEGGCVTGERAVCDPACAAGKKCCDGKCLAAQCCTNADCAAFPQTPECIDYACQKCSSDVQCGLGRKCCGGSCQAGTCCPGEVCANGQACIAYSCQGCTFNTDCGAGGRCCNKLCTTGSCCSNSDCKPYVCSANQCVACLSNTDCGEGSLCCNGACHPGATCCSKGDCPSGQICGPDKKCATCTSSAQCGRGQACCGGKCIVGNCCSNADCNTAVTGLVCQSGACLGCSGDGDCGDGHKCCAGRCVAGACCLDSECPAGKKCINNGCGACTTQGPTDLRGTCGFGEVCCNGSCKPGSCCDGQPQCNEGALICSGFSCKACDANLRCPTGSRCCGGACYPGFDCCTDSDCGGQRCVAGKCAACSVDSDCGGSMSCCPGNADPTKKYCKPYCQTGQTSDTGGDFTNGTFDGTGQQLPDNDPNNPPLDPECTQPGKLCLSGHASTTDTSYIWIPTTNENAVYHFNADTLALLHGGKLGVRGTDPSRTAINTNDLSIWVGSRGFSSNSNSGVTHISHEGKILCWGQVGGYARAVALESNGDCWVGSFEQRKMYKFSGALVDNPGAAVPTCRLLKTVDIPGTPYGAATDADDRIWVGLFQHGLYAFDGKTGAKVHHLSTPGLYGMTVDKKYAWVGAYYSNRVTRCNLDTGSCAHANTGGNPRGLSVATDGNVYAGLANASMAIIDRETLNFHIVTPRDQAGNGFSHTITTAVDKAGRVWIVDYNAQKAVRYHKGDQTCATNNHGACSSKWCWEGRCAVANNVTVGGHPYAYTDLTGVQSIIAHVPPGFWRGIYDSSLTDIAQQPFWLKAVVKAKIPEQTTVQVRGRVAMDKAAFQGANQPAWGAWIDVPRKPVAGYADYDVDITSVNTPNNARARRYLQLEFRLETKQDDRTPVIDAITVKWSPPDPAR